MGISSCSLCNAALRGVFSGASSEVRGGGLECSSRWPPYHDKQNDGLIG